MHNWYDRKEGKEDFNPKDDLLWIWIKVIGVITLVSWIASLMFGKKG